jgi:hypothetical protein
MAAQVHPLIEGALVSPRLELPHIVIEPSILRAAKAAIVE